MIDLYYAPTPNGWKISIMLEECEIDYRVISVNLGKGDQFKPDFLKISPNNRMPVIVDHGHMIDDQPLSIFESGHSKLGAIKSTFPDTLAGLLIEAITQSGFVLEPENV